MEILTNNHKHDKMQPDARGTADFFSVTAMKPAQKSQNRVNIFLNDDFAFSLDLAQVVDFGLKIGKILNLEEIENLKSASEYGKLYQSTLEWILTRPHSEKETHDNLKQKQYKRSLENKKRLNNREKLKQNPELKSKQKDFKIHTKLLPEISDENIEKVFATLKSRGYLDDEKFVKFYLENRFVKKGISQKRLKMELLKKGINEKTITKFFSETPRDESEEIKKVIQKKRQKYDDEKLIQYLVRQGFDFELSRNLVRGTDW